MASLLTGTTIAGNVALHAGNYNSYSPSLTGSGASGNWSINSANVTISNLNTQQVSISLAAGSWYTIAANDSNRASAKFTVTDTSSGLHQSVHFYATAHYGTDTGAKITVVSNTYYGGPPVSAIRIMRGSTYEGAMVQIYALSACNLVVSIYDNQQSSGWVIKSGVVSTTNPGTVANFAALTTVAASADLTAAKSFTVSDDLYIGGATTQYKALHTNSTLTAGNLSGTIPSAVLGNSTHYIGTTAIALNRASASQSLTGINIDGSSGSCTGNAATATTLQTARAINGVSFNGSAAITVDGLNYSVNNVWLRENGDDAQFQMYGNSRTMIYRTDGNTNPHGGGGYAHIFYYGGSADANRVFIINTDGRLWSPYHGWLDTMSISGNAATATNLSTSRTNWSTNGTISAVVGQLSWKNYGNNHTIFDASNSTNPGGGAINNTNPDVAWTGTYPTLMGWNGTSTYGVRVDSSRYADNVLYSPSRTDGTAYPVLWGAGSSTTQAYSCAAVTILSSTGTLSATSFSGAGTGLTGTAASLTAGTANAVATGAVKAGGLDTDSVITVKIANSNVTYAKIQNVTNSTILGRITAGAGVVEELTGANVTTIIGANAVTNATNATNATTATTANALNTGNSYTINGLTSNSTINIFPAYSSPYSYFLRMGYDNSGSYDYTIKRNGTTGFLEFNGTQGAPYVGYVFATGDVYSGLSSATSGAYYFNSTSHGLRRASGTNDVYLFTTTGTLYLGTTGNASQQIIINNSGNLGVGTSPASYKLDVNGSCHATSFPTSSDERFKKKIRPLENCVEKVKKMQGVSYEWNEFINNRRDGYSLNTPVFGVIAQDLEKVIPEVVSKWHLSDDCKDARAVDYIRIIPVLIEAIKEQQVELDDLKKRLLALENK